MNSTSAHSAHHIVATGVQRELFSFLESETLGGVMEKAKMRK
jgi:hypothetical protein